MEITRRKKSRIMLNSILWTCVACILASALNFFYRNFPGWDVFLLPMLFASIIHAIRSLLVDHIDLKREQFKRQDHLPKGHAEHFHAARRTILMQRFPGIRDLLGPSHFTVSCILLTVIFDIIFLARVRHLSVVWQSIACILVGGYFCSICVSHWYHEIGHKLVTPSKYRNHWACFLVFFFPSTGANADYMLRGHIDVHHALTYTKTDHESLDWQRVHLSSSMGKQRLIFVLKYLIFKPWNWASRLVKIVLEMIGGTHTSARKSISKESTFCAIAGIFFSFLFFDSLTVCLWLLLSPMGFVPVAPGFINFEIADHFMSRPGQPAYGNRSIWWNFISLDWGYHVLHHDLPRLSWMYYRKVGACMNSEYEQLENYSIVQSIKVLFKGIDDVKLEEIERMTSSLIKKDFQFQSLFLPDA